MPSSFLYCTNDGGHILALVDSCTSSSWQRRTGKRRRLARVGDPEIHIPLRRSEKDAEEIKMSLSQRDERSAV